MKYLKMLMRLPYALVNWTVFAAVKLTLVVIGLVAVKMALRHGLDSDFWPSRYWLWGNEEEGYPAWSPVSPYKWYAIRNPVNNLRLLFHEPRFLTVLGTPNMDTTPGLQWRYAYGGWKDSFRVTWGKVRPFKGKKEFYIGWKIGSNVPGVGFTLQLRAF
jgi:hypothetical protein